MNRTLQIMIISGVEDGTLLTFSEERDGQMQDGTWTLRIGRREDNDICLKNDTFVSRQHANLHYKNSQWALEDCESTNGTFIEDPIDFFTDERVHGTVYVDIGQPFRIGRTWIRVQPSE
jgi:predicted component of type VI protein secretion system